MAKQSGPVKIVGTIDDLTFYEMNGEHYVRKKSGLKGKRVKKDPQFENTMRNANWLGEGAQLASPVYRQLPKERRVQGVMGKMSGMAAGLLRKGLSKEAIVEQLKVYWLSAPKPVKQEPIVVQGCLSLSRKVSRAASTSHVPDGESNPYLLSVGSGLCTPWSQSVVPDKNHGLIGFG